MSNELENESSEKPDEPKNSEAEERNSPPAEGSTTSSETDRREFMIKAGSMVFGGVVVAIPAGAGLMTFLSPMLKKSGEGVRVRLAGIDDLPDDGTPKRFDVVYEKVDSWMKYPAKPIGGVFLRKTEEGKVTAYNSSCPHAGCSVVFQADRNIYDCPCHDSTFLLDGARGNVCVSPRGLDQLEVDEEAVAASGDIWVTFRNFKAGVSEKIATS